MRRDHCLRGPIGDSVRARRAEYILGLHGSRHLGGCGTVLRILPGYPRRQSRSHCLLTIRMKNIQLNWVQIPLHEPFRISSGAIAVKDAIVVQYRKDGVTGWGEASPMAGAFYSQETPESTWAALQKMASADIPWSALGEFEGENFAKAGLAGAIVDRDLRARGVPLWQFLESTDRPVPSGVAIGIYDTVEELLARVDRFSREGYRRVKV